VHPYYHYGTTLLLSVITIFLILIYTLYQKTPCLYCYCGEGYCFIGIGTRPCSSAISVARAPTSCWAVLLQLGRRQIDLHQSPHCNSWPAPAVMPKAAGTPVLVLKLLRAAPRIGLECVVKRSGVVDLAVDEGMGRRVCRSMCVAFCFIN
jgi:hypothetical protein